MKLTNAVVKFSDGTTETFLFAPPSYEESFQKVAAELDRLIEGTLEYDRNPGVRVVTVVLEYFAP
jgi:hypothetical protein